MDKLKETILAFAREHAGIPGENLWDLVELLVAGNLVARSDADEKMQTAFSELLSEGALVLRVRKNQFLRLHPAN